MSLGEEFLFLLVRTIKYAGSSQNNAVQSQSKVTLVGYTGFYFNLFILFTEDVLALQVTFFTSSLHQLQL